eukprot:jgi/Mesvir1/1962/Mv16851-RA.1
MTLQLLALAGSIGAFFIFSAGVLMTKMAEDTESDVSDDDIVTEENSFDKDDYIFIPPAKKTDQFLEDLNTPDRILAIARENEERRRIENAMMERIPAPMEIPVRAMSRCPDTIEEPDNAVTASSMTNRLGNHAGRWYALGPLVAVFDDTDLTFYVARILPQEFTEDLMSHAPVIATHRTSVPSLEYTKNDIDSIMNNLARQAPTSCVSKSYLVMHDSEPYNIGIAMFECTQPREGNAGNYTARKIFVFRYTDFYSYD